MQHASGPSVVVITGIMASGKSTVAQLLAERFPRSVHVRGDVFRRMVVSGRVEKNPGEDAEADAQLRLRYRASAAAVGVYAEAGWTVVVQDVILGDYLDAYLEFLSVRPVHVVVLAPRPEVVAVREAGRIKSGYSEGGWTVDGLDAVLRGETPRRGLWLDTSEWSSAETVDVILARLHEARVVS
ncbi:phosphotransferase-like protein [Yinghuangia sp. YIM S10712]|uniref:phosphotransferase-like protein n=1 Tax=Yinghuangia sp. YIM S10712 TaxID=3436930 RepID=UPI003F52EC59